MFSLICQIRCLIQRWLFCLHLSLHTHTYKKKRKQFIKSCLHVFPSNIGKVIIFDLNRKRIVHLMDAASALLVQYSWLKLAGPEHICMRTDQSSWRLLSWEGSGLLLYVVTVSWVPCDLLASLDPAWCGAATVCSVSTKTYIRGICPPPPHTHTIKHVYYAFIFNQNVAFVSCCH